MAHSTTGTSYRKTILPNGLRVITESIPSVRSIAVGAWIDTGSRDETAEESGISHFIEHMVFKGTRRRKTFHIAQRMESVGGYLNAFTAKEYTCYYTRALDEHLGRAVDLLFDLIGSPTFPPKEIEKEKEVVLEEMRMYDDNPEELIFDRFESVVYAGHPLGRPIIGTRETVQSFSAEDLFGYIARGYNPARIVLAVSGNCDHDEVVRLADRYSTGLVRPDVGRERLPVNGYAAAHVMEERPIQQAHLVMGLRAPGMLDPRRTTLSVLNTLLGGGMSSRLNQNIRERYGFCYNIYSFLNLNSDSGDFGVYMGTDRAKIERARKLITRELDRLTQDLISPRLLAQIKSQVKGAIMLGLESMSNRMTRIGRQELFFGRYFSLDDALEELERVTAEDIRIMAGELFGSSEYSSVVLLPK